VETPQRNLQIAQAFWKLTFYRKAQRYAQKVLESQNADEQTSDKARLILARLDLINGQPEQATAQLKQIQDHENKEYQSLSERLELEKMLAELKPDQQEAVLKLASLYQSEGIPGKALTLLSKAHALTPDNRQILQRLAELQLFYHLLPEAEASYLKLKQFSPADGDVNAALKKIADLKQVPQF